MSQGSRPAGQCARTVDDGRRTLASLPNAQTSRPSRDTTEVDKRDMALAVPTQGATPAPHGTSQPVLPVTLPPCTAALWKPLSELHRMKKKRVFKRTERKCGGAGLLASTLSQDHWSPCLPCTPSEPAEGPAETECPHAGRARLPRDAAAWSRGGGRTGGSPATLGADRQPQASCDLAPQGHSPRALFPHLSSGATSSPCRDCVRSSERPGWQLQRNLAFSPFFPQTQGSLPNLQGS